MDVFSARTIFIMNETKKLNVNAESVDSELNDANSTFDDSDADKNYLPSESDYESEISNEENRNPETTKKRKKKRKLQFECRKQVDKVNINKGTLECETSVKDTEMLTTVSEEDNSAQPTNNSKKITTIDTTGDENNEGCVKKTKSLTLTDKTIRDKTKHPMLNKCAGKCRKDCNKLSENNRQEIWENYWSLEYTSRRKWMSKHIKLVPIKRRLALASHPKSDTRKFTLPHHDFTEVSVCRVTFLNTLGYTNDSVITELVAAIKRAPCGSMVKECRGIHPKPKGNRELIKNHIESYHPCVSHYRRLNAPNIRYLPRELTVKDMYTDFHSKFPGVCKIEIYRQVLKEMNISLCAPKSDICEQCQLLNLSLESTTNEDKQQEDAMLELNNHKLKAEKANREYKKDAEETIAEKDDNKRIYSMDLQKVMLLPMMPQVKSSFFISRLVIFNETFATLNKKSQHKNYCVVWHEASGGRKAEAITDSIVRVISEERDVKKFTFWADNCTGQNKNWILFTGLITQVNLPTGPDEIRIRYLTKGHTHMTADGIHGNIEKKIGRKRNVYDFQELVDVISSSRKNVYVLELNKFYLWSNERRVLTRKNDDTLKGFILNPLVEVKFTKGSRNMKYKTDFDEEFKEIDFLRKKHTVPHVPESVATRGIKAIKKNKIVNELVPLMPLNRRIFWESLPESEASPDLVISD